MKKRMFSLILALLMLGSLFSASALAEGEIVMDLALWEPDAVQGPPVEGPEEDEAPALEPEQPAPEMQPIQKRPEAGTGSDEVGSTIVDTTPPTVTDISLSPSSVPVPGQITVTVSASDDISGVADCQICFRYARTGHILECSPSINSGGTFTGTIQVDEYANSGAYVISSVDLTDNAGNAEHYYGEGNPSYTYCEPRLPDSLASLSIAVLNPNPVDDAPPTVTGVSLSASRVTAPGQITVTVSASDNVSGVDSTSCYVSFQNAETDSVLSCFLSKDGSGTFTGTIQVGEYANSGTYGISFVYLEDNAGNNARYYGKGNLSYAYCEPRLPDSLASLSFSVDPSFDAAPVLNAANGPSGVQLSWNALPNAPRYNIYRKVGSGSWSWLAGTTGTSYTDTTASPGATYTYRMAVVSADGKTMLSPMSAEKSVTRYAAPALSVANVSNGVRLSWPSLPGAPRFNLYRKVGSGNWAWLAASTGTSYVDTKVSSGTAYTYRMAVVTADGKSMLSPMGAEKSITYTPSALAAPVIVSIANVANGIQLKWNAVSGAPRYNIYRKVGSGSWSWLAASTGTVYIDGAVTHGTTYTYRMAVVTADGKSMLSAMGGERILTH